MTGDIHILRVQTIYAFPLQKQYRSYHSCLSDSAMGIDHSKAKNKKEEKSLWFYMDLSLTRKSSGWKS